MVYSYYVFRGSVAELSTSKQSSQLARVRVTPGTRFINIRTYYLLSVQNAI